MIAGRSKARAYICLFLAAASVALLLSVLYLSHVDPSWTTKTKGYIQGIVGHPQEPSQDVSEVQGAGEVQTPDAAQNTDAAKDAGETKGSGESNGEEDHETWFEDKWPFQADVDGYDLPSFDREKLKNFPPHNYRGPGHETFATFFASQNATLQDPYFVATMQVIYRFLWDPNSKTDKHPVTVFVAPFISQEQRDYFAAAGAIVRELARHPFTPHSEYTVSSRWADMFSKLEMWRQTDFSRIAYLDSDAFPMQNCDAIFAAAPEKVCDKKLLPAEDQAYASTICKYVMAGHMETNEMVNGGVLILKPDQAMYARLMRESQNQGNWDNGLMEQAFLSYAFRKDGPFHITDIPKGWNSFHHYRGEGVDIKILHDKMWAHFFEPNLWPTDNYKLAWADMLELYNSDQFLKLRKEDRMRAYEGL